MNSDRRGTGQDTSPSDTGVNSYMRGTGQDTSPLDLNGLGHDIGFQILTKLTFLGLKP